MQLFARSRFVRAFSNEKALDYRSTLNLPATSFPLRSKAAIKEESTQKDAKFYSLYDWQWNRDDLPVFSLHDGPPYANGETHVGHALNKILKDVIIRFRMMSGYRVHYVPGWDCHGLPIELKALRSGEDRQAKPLTVRREARRFAEKCVQQQMESFQRWGLLADWSKIYKTLDKSYEANQLRVFFSMYEKGHIYRGVKPVFWSPSSRTALAEAELEYYDYVSKSVYVKLVLDEANLPDILKGEEGGPPSLLIWTTTPWTLPANRAVCYSADAQYCLVTCGRELFIVAAERIANLEHVLGEKITIVKSFPGSVLERLKYRHPFENDSLCLTLPASHVTMESGTGLVHTAPAHGQDDYHVGKEHGLDLSCHVDDNGSFSSGEFHGKDVLGDGNDAVIAKLKTKQALVKLTSYTHRYPHDWRTKKPVILRSTPQWFASLENLKHDAVKCLRDVKMTPSVSVNRMLAMLRSRDDWCISRQRVWGVPIPAFYNKETGDAFMNRSSVDHVISLVEKHGTDCWWEFSLDRLLPPRMAPRAGDYIRGEDTMDVWFDSGTSWATVLKDLPNGGVADLYLEGSDQHRGWFQSSLLTRVAFDNRAPYRHVITHGFVLDEEGQKMSKSIGNVVSPDDIIKGTKNKPGIGADVLRLWASSTDYTSDVLIGPNVLSQMSDLFRKIRNTARFMLGCLHDFDPDVDMIAYKEMNPLDQYLLHLLRDYAEKVTIAYEEATFSKVNHHLTNLIAIDLSAFYFDSIKDRLYVEEIDSRARRSAQTTLFHILTSVTKSFAPVAPHLAEEIYAHRRGREGESTGAFKNGWIETNKDWHRPELASDFVIGRQVKDLCNQAMEIARVNKTIGSSLDADLIITARPGRIFQALERLHGSVGLCGSSSLAEILVASHVTLLSADGHETIEDLCVHTGLLPEKRYSVSGTVQDEEGNGDEIWVETRRCGFHKCPRCWKFWSSNEGSLCQRCQHVLRNAESMKA